MAYQDGFADGYQAAVQDVLGIFQGAAGAEDMVDDLEHYLTVQGVL